MSNKDKLIEEFWFGKQLYQGERGGKYYLNESGNKIYVNESYEELVQLRRNFKALSKILIAQASNEISDEVADDKSEYQCASCRFYKETTSECSLDIPECGTEYVNDCSSYIKDK